MKTGQMKDEFETVSWAIFYKSDGYSTREECLEDLPWWVEYESADHVASRPYVREYRHAFLVTHRCGRNI